MRPVVGLLTLMLLFSCGGRTSRQQGEGDSQQAGASAGLAFRYATLPSVTEYDGYTVVTLANPWKEGQTLHTYVLVPRELPMPDHLPKGTVIRTPLRKAVVFTTVHTALLLELGCQDRIAGVADLKYIKIPWIHKQVAKGRVTETA